MTVQLDHIVLNVKNVASSLGFYVGVLGLTPERVQGYHEGEFLFPSVRINEHSLIDLLPPELRESQGLQAPNPSAPNMDHFCLSLPTERWLAIVAELDKQGIEIEAGPMTLWGAHGDATAVYIRDPDGNRVELRHYETS
jgi:glyoxylase I family protein